MTDRPGGPPEERLPARRPEPTPAPVERFSAPPRDHAFGLSGERAAQIVRQSANARFMGFIATVFTVLFLILYYFYELGIPAVEGTSRLQNEVEFQQVTAVERGYELYQANCAQCHGSNGEGGAGPVLNDQSKLLQHLTEPYIRNVLHVGGRLVCGDPASLMPVWALENGGPLNYQQINEIVAFLRAPNALTFEVHHEDGTVETKTGWRDPAYEPPADATPVPACWKDAFGGGGGSPSPGPSETLPPDAASVDVLAENAQDFTTQSITAPAGETFGIHFVNDDSVIHNVWIRDAAGSDVFESEIISGGTETTYVVPALDAGDYEFYCQVHPNMVGDLTVE